MGRVTVLRDLGLGDLLTAVPALRALRRAYPQARVALVMSAALAPLARWTGAVDDVMAEPEADPPPDLAVNLHGRGPQSHRRLLACDPARLIAFAHPDVAASASGPPWVEDEHEVTRWCRLLESYGIPADRRDLDLDPGGAARDDNRTVLHPGAGSGARRWPPERFALVARAEAAKGRQVRISGSPGEVAVARAIARRAGLPLYPTVAAGDGDVLDLLALIASAGRVVCGDTGVAHLATAVGTPSVVLFGPTPPSQWGPPPDRPWHRALWAGETGDPHGGHPAPGLLAITVDDVLGALVEIDRLAPGPALPSGSMHTGFA